MLYVIASGILGFLVYDCYRIHATYREKDIVFITFSSSLGMFIHFGVYVAAGILALFINLDTIDQCCSWEWLPNMSQDMVGPLVRGFGIGLAGPAGLSKGKVNGERERMENTRHSLDELSPARGAGQGAKVYIKKILMR